jgi:hypothetical protein
LVLALVSVSVTTLAAPAATVRGRVLHGPKGVPGASVTLVESDPALVAVNPGAAKSADGQGRFEFASVDATKRWKLVVFDPFRPGEISVVTEANLTGENEIHVNRLIRFTEPLADAVVSGPKVRVRFTPVPGAARYILEVEERQSLARSSRSLTAPEVELQVEPARSYALSVKALDAGGIEIGADIIHGGAVHAFGVSDPVAERELLPMDAACTIAGLEPHLRVAPSASSGAEVAFMVARGDRIRVRGKWKTWRKVTTVTGYYPGRDGWLSEGEVSCPAK